VLVQGNLKRSKFSKAARGGQDGEAFVLQEAGDGQFRNSVVLVLSTAITLPSDQRVWGFGSTPQLLQGGASRDHGRTGGPLTALTEFAPVLVAVAVLKRKPGLHGRYYPYTKVLNTGNKSAAIRLSSVMELLQYAFAIEPGSTEPPLDERIQGQSVELLPGHESPFRRLTGLKIQLEFVYDIKLDWRDTSTTERPTCELQVGLLIASGEGGGGGWCEAAGESDGRVGLAASRHRTENKLALSIV
jgi:hypothetical protein